MKTIKLKIDETTNRQVKNPRTAAQTLQRVLVKVVALTYAMLKSICNHSFEGVSNGSQCMNMFKKLNLRYLRDKASTLQDIGQSLKQFFQFMPLQSDKWAPFAAIISQGHLPEVKVSIDAAGNEYSQSKSKGHDAPIDINVVVENSDYFGKTLKDIACIAEGTVVCSRIKRDGILSVPTKDMMLVSGDILHLVGGAKYVTKTASEIGTETKDVLTTHGSTLTVRHLVITKNNVMGRTLGELDLESHYGIVVSRVFRSGIQFMPDPNFRLAMGDEINVIGQLENVRKAARVVGNSATTMNKVPMLPIFVGLFLGMLLGSLELAIPGVPAPLKLGIIGGTLVVAILLARFGDAWSRNHIHWRLPQPAISSFKEFGITLFLTIVGIRAGASGFWDTLTNGDGLVWMAWATLISIIPLLIVGFIGYKIAKVNYLVLCGVLAGACTDPPALAYANGLHKDAEASSIGYATVYPFVMFLRILSPQIMLLIMSASFI